jgi:RNA 3'-terminal phosphate cyclase-like protein
MSASAQLRLQQTGGRSDTYVKAEDDGTHGRNELKKKLEAVKKKRMRTTTATSSTTKKKKKKRKSITSSTSSTSTLDMPTATGNTRVRVFGCSHFRQHIICSTLSGRSLRLERIRDRDERPGLRPFEANFLRLMDKLTNGAHIEINSTGTTLLYNPGIIVGGKVTHDCGLGRSVGYFIEGILPLCFFAKKNVALTLRGITNDNIDLSVDCIRGVLLPTLLSSFHLQEESPKLDLKIKKRGAPPGGGGEVILTVPIVKVLKSTNRTEVGFVKRIRGIAYSTRVSPQISNRMVTSARSLLNHFVPDVFVYTDHYKGDESGKSPGFGICLMAETTNKIIVMAEKMAEGGVLPETLGLECKVSLFLALCFRYMC